MSFVATANSILHAGAKPVFVDVESQTGNIDADLIETALTQNRPVLIEFTADWCLSCAVVEKMVYSRKDIAELIEQKDVLAIKADTTLRDYPATVALKDVYNEPGVPVSILFAPGEKEPVRCHCLSFADELKTHLKGLSPR